MQRHSLGPLKALVKVLTKLCLNNSRDMADLIGACYSCFILAAAHPLVLAVLAAGKQYYESCKEAGRDHTYGPPWTHMWLALLTALLEHPETPETSKKALKVYWEANIAGDRSSLHQLQDQI
eukprot:2148086-Pyramimonas_sp.AAC.1